MRVSNVQRIFLSFDKETSEAFFFGKVLEFFCMLLIFDKLRWMHENYLF